MIYFEDLTVGDRFETPARTITETDVVMFAGLTGDYNNNHTNAEAARQKEFGERIAHGLLIMMLTRGLMFRTRVTGTAAEQDFLGIPSVTFRTPVKFGDTIRVNFCVRERVEDPDGPGQGVVLFDCETVNQRGELVLQSVFKVRMARSPS
jgi:acyl dehydratase